MSTPADGCLQVTRQRDGRWRWTWTDGDGFELVSNESFPERDEAVSAAVDAYPEAALEAEEAPSPRRRRRRVGPLLAVLVVAFLALRRGRVGRTRVGTGPH